MYQLIDGKELAKNIRQELKKENDKLKEKGINAKLAVIRRNTKNKRRRI